MLLCTVRGCGEPLIRDGRRLVCARGHSFDLARSGYANLLQPQDRRSHSPGDSKAVVAARRRLHEAGVTGALLDAIVEHVGASATDSVLDVGCGDGFYLGSLNQRVSCAAYGVDISRAAIEVAARRYPGVEWVVANADRFLPFAAAAFSRVMSITARMNPSEFRRVLAPDGRLLVAVPAPDDLAEIRGRGRDRTSRTISDFAEHFRLESHDRVRTVAPLSADQVEDLRLIIYRPLQEKPPQQMQVTFSLDLLDFRPQP
ncbi:MAG: methyltransferase domain-containing protein [Bryobacterales bacterium]|nr:methyltransferase domain-containing protein [Bryobacterales bacterium]